MLILRSGMNERDIIQIDADTLEGYNFKGQNLHRAVFDGMDLTKCDFDSLIIRNASFRRSLLCGSSFVEARAANTYFDDAKLMGVDFSNATLAGASFRGSKLHHVNFSGSNIESANFEDTDVYEVDFKGCIFDQSTTLPKGFTIEKMEEMGATHKEYPLEVSEIQEGCYLIYKKLYINGTKLSFILNESTETLDIWLKERKVPDTGVWVNSCNNDRIRLFSPEYVVNLLHILQKENYAENIRRSGILKLPDAYIEALKTALEKR